MAGELEEAEKRFPAVLEMEKIWGEHRDQCRTHWICARVALQRGKYDEAESMLRRASDGYLYGDLNEELVLLAFDLAAVYVEQGRYNDLGRLAEDLLPAYNCEGLSTPTRENLDKLQKAAKLRSQAKELIREIQETR